MSQMIINHRGIKPKKSSTPRDTNSDKDTLMDIRDDPEYKTRQIFKARGIHPTLEEYREVYACMQNGSNPLGIH